MKATEGEAAVAVVAEGRVGLGVKETEVERLARRVGATRPVVAIVAGTVQVSTISVTSIDISATDKEEILIKGDII